MIVNIAGYNEIPYELHVNLPLHHKTAEPTIIYHTLFNLTDNSVRSWGSTPNSTTQDVIDHFTKLVQKEPECSI